MADKQVIFDSAEAATYRTDIKGWVSRDGRFFGEDERTARWAGCTHQTCECGNIHEKGRVRCNSCQAKMMTERYYALPMIEWDGATPVCVYDDDKYFFDEGELLDWIEEQGEGAEIQLVLCTPGRLRLIDSEQWADDLPEDGELPDEVAKKLDELNEAIKRAPTVCWFAGKTRIDVDALKAQLKA